MKYHHHETDEARFEYRPPDATANPYLCLSAMLLAGIDGVLKKIDPVKEGFGPFDKNIQDHSKNDHIQFLPRDLNEALEALLRDSAFLKLGDVFTDELIDQWVEAKRKEIRSIGTMPHPFEYKLYFNL